LTNQLTLTAVGVKMSESGNTGEVIKGMGLLELGQELGSQVIILLDEAQNCNIDPLFLLFIVDV